MTANELVSVIIPAYKHEQYVQAAIRSAIDQSWPHLELVAIDDGSPDGTWAAIEAMETECRERFQRVKFLRHDNQGVCETLNRLLAEAQGEYFMRLDSDDLIKPQSIEKQLAFLREHSEYGLTVGDNEIIDETGQVVHWTADRANTLEPAKTTFKTFGAFLRSIRPDLDFLSDDFGRHETLWGNYVPNGYLVRRRLMDGVKFSSQAPREDFFMMLQLAKRGKFKYFDEIMHSYRWHQTNNIKNPGTNAMFTNLTLKDELRRLKAAGDQDRRQRLLSSVLQWKTRIKLKIGGLELCRVMDMFDERKLYELHLGSYRWPLFELRRNNTETRTPWRLARVRADDELGF